MGKKGTANQLKDSYIKTVMHKSSLVVITWIMYGLLPIFRISDMFLICCWTREASKATNMERVKTL